MKSFLFSLVVVALFLSSCQTAKKIIYFQDVAPLENITTRAIQPLHFVPGDKVRVLVTSASTPQVAYRFNLAAAQRYVGSENSSGSYITAYTVDENGCINIPSLGEVKIAGLTRSEAQKMIEKKLHAGLLNDAVVTISSFDQAITVLGEVHKPGRITLNKDNITILEALGQAGDLTIQARRNKILVMRQDGKKMHAYYVDLRSKKLLDSPAYNLQQNDIVYVEPNKVRMSQSTYNGNSLRQIGTWLSITSVLMSLGILVFRR